MLVSNYRTGVKVNGIKYLYRRVRNWRQAIKVVNTNNDIE